MPIGDFYSPTLFVNSFLIVSKSGNRSAGGVITPAFLAPLHSNDLRVRAGESPDFQSGMLKRRMAWRTQHIGPLIKIFLAYSMHGQNFIAYPIAIHTGSAFMTRMTVDGKAARPGKMQRRTELIAQNCRSGFIFHGEQRCNKAVYIACTLFCNFSMLTPAL
jgi:hypothetical protein